LEEGGRLRRGGGWRLDLRREAGLEDGQGFGAESGGNCGGKRAISRRDAGEVLGRGDGEIGTLLGTLETIAGD
jgi:hypothetical protein